MRCSKPTSVIRGPALQFERASRIRSLQAFPQIRRWEEHGKVRYASLCFYPIHVVTALPRASYGVIKMEAIVTDEHLVQAQVRDVLQVRAPVSLVQAVRTAAARDMSTRSVLNALPFFVTTLPTQQTSQQATLTDPTLLRR
jgi:hypothetical protein